MSGVWNRTLVYLGLREEPEAAYDDLPERFVPEDDPHAEHAPPRRSAQAPPIDVRDPAPAGVPVGGRNGADATAEFDSDNVRALRTADPRVHAVPSTPLSRAAVVQIAVFNDVEAVGARYRTGQPVLFDVSSADSATARRVVDFVSGLAFGLRGELTKVGSRAFLVLPTGVALPAEERRRLHELGYRLPVESDA